VQVPEGLAENLWFLIREVRAQLERTSAYIAAPTPSHMEAIRSRDDYIDHLRNVVRRKCYEEAAATGDPDSSSLEELRAVDVIAGNLERIADFCESVMVHVMRQGDGWSASARDFEPFLAEVMGGLSRVEAAIFERNVQLALAICKSEEQLDQLYKKLYERIVAELGGSDAARRHISTILIGRYFERMGDSLLNIGEAALSASLGERIKIEGFRALEGTLQARDGGASGAASVSDVALEMVAQTQSGTRIDSVWTRAQSEAERLGIFKEGRTDKLLEEKQGIDRWSRVLPGVVPNVYAFHERGEQSAILLEYLPGRTLEDIVLRSDSADLTSALVALGSMLQTLWGGTRTPGRTPAGFVHQLAKRLPAVYAVHPEFRTLGGAIGGLDVPTFDALVERATPLDDHLVAPFAVLGHGDFNVDNILYEASSQRVRIVDLHRSCMMDYVQDVSVFLLSNYRLQVFEAPVRRRINEAILWMWDLARDFAHKSGDRTFEARLALGLARSFTTSARFVLDPELAKDMFLRSRYLLELLLARGVDGLSGVRVPEEVLVD
jgi:phosphate uptake regulator/aminoglycoside phosphotransferase (APT) family kinase protein